MTFYFLLAFAIFLIFAAKLTKIGPFISLIWVPPFTSFLSNPIKFYQLFIQALDTENQFLQKALLVDSPNFQDNKFLVFYIIIYFSCCFLLKDLPRRWKIFNLLSLFFALFLNSYFYFFIIHLAYLIFKLLKSNKNTSNIIICFSFFTIFTLQTFSISNLKQYQSFESLVTGTEEHSKIIIDYDFRNRLPTEINKFFPNFPAAKKNKVLVNLEYLSKSTEYEDYYNIQLLKNNWKELLEKNSVKYALLRRDSALAGILIEVENWSILKQTEKEAYLDRGKGKLSEIVLLKRVE